MDACVNSGYYRTDCGTCTDIEIQGQIFLYKENYEKEAPVYREINTSCMYKLRRKSL